MSEREPVPYEEALASALEAVMAVDEAYGIVLIDAGLHEDDVHDIQQAVRDLIAEALNA